MISTEIIKDAKKRHVPAPGTYNPKLSSRVLFGKPDKTEKSASFIDSALEVSMRVPAAKYEDLAAWKKTQKKVFAMKMQPEGGKLNLPKPKRPDMGSYYKDTFDKLTFPKTITHPLSKGIKETFSDEYVKLKKFVPAPSKYDVTKIYDRISRNPYS